MYTVWQPVSVGLHCAQRGCQTRLRPTPILLATLNIQNIKDICKK